MEIKLYGFRNFLTSNNVKRTIDFKEPQVYDEVKEGQKENAVQSLGK
ncbi:MAG: hypothetical protein N2645_05045 [Clostridia bacterium]|nr:hypothetical protein [Clostridia bacterium]